MNIFVAMVKVLNCKIRKLVFGVLMAQTTKLLSYVSYPSNC